MRNNILKNEKSPFIILGILAAFSVTEKIIGKTDFMDYVIIFSIAIMGVFIVVYQKE